MIKLKKLKLKNFGSFKQEQTIDFPSSGLLLLHGDNGSGKSSILKAIAYCLDFLSEPASEFINWDNQEDIAVELILSVKNQDFILQRGNGFFKLEYDKIKVSGADVPKKISEILIDPKFMSTMSYRGQGDVGNFSTLKPSEKQDFLSELLSLMDFESVIEKSEINLKILEDQLVQKDNKRLVTWNLAETQAAKIADDETIKMEEVSKLELLEKTVVNEKIGNSDEIDKNILELEILVKMDDGSTLFEVNQEIDIKMAELDGVVTSREKLSLDQKSVMKDIALLNEKISSFKNNIKQKDKINSDLIKLNANKCPTCEQQWNNNLLLIKNCNEKLFQIEKDEESLIFNTNELNIVLEKYKERNQQITDLNKESDIINKDLSKLSFEKQQTGSNRALNEEKLKSLRKQKIALTDNYNVRINSLNDQINQLKNNITRYSNVFEVNCGKLVDLNAELELIEQSKNKIIVQMNNEKEILNATKDFLRLVTEDTLKMISSEVSDFIQHLPNAKTFCIKFDTSKLNKNGKIKKEIVLKTYKGGQEIPFRRLSGGERCSTNLAIDLAVSNILSLRTGKNLGWFAFDESLDGMTVENKMEALNMLKVLSKDKLILLIEHTSELSEVFDKVVHVTQTASGSSVQFIS